MLSTPVRTMWVRDASPAQIKAHLGECPDVCMSDGPLLDSLAEQNKALRQGDDCMSRFWGGEIDARVGDLHGQSIPVPQMSV